MCNLKFLAVVELPIPIHMDSKLVIHLYVLTYMYILHVLKLLCRIVLSNKSAVTHRPIAHHCDRFMAR